MSFDHDTRVILLVAATLTLGIPLDALGPAGSQTGLYHYRLRNRPLFILPGHALVFTAAMRISRRVPSWFPWAVLAGFMWWGRGLA